jgi:hypothetical protein
MEKQIKMYNGDLIVRYTETEEKKQRLWDAFIKWCEEHNASSGESYQSDDFQIDAPEFMADAIDEIVQFDTEFVS